MLNKLDFLLKIAFKSFELSIEEIEIAKNLYKINGKEKIYQFAKDKKILPFIAVLMLRLKLDEDFWNSIAIGYQKRNEIIINHLNNIFNKFSENKVKKVFVTENFGALLISDADKALFASGDVDIYADINEKERIYKAFKQLGYTIKEIYSHRKLISTSFYNNDLLPDGFYFGVAWNPLSRMKLPSFIEADDFVEWDALWKYKNTAIKLPDPDSLMYICLLHISLHSFSRAPDIRLYIDIINILKLSVNWEKIILHAKRDNTMIRMLVACIIARKLLNVKIPESVLNYRKHYEKSISNLLNIVYDKNNNCLLYEPTGIKILYIEVLMNDRSILSGIQKIIFPKKQWVKDCYVGREGNMLVGYLKHIINLI